MRIVIDVESNRLHNPDKIWVISCKDIDKHKITVFRNVTDDPIEMERFRAYWRSCKYYIGHNLLGFDLPVLEALCGVSIEDAGRDCLDTLIISKMADFSRSGHSVKDFGIEFNLHKGDFKDWSKYSLEMEEYCIRDVEITHRIYNKYVRFINNPRNADAIRTEHRFQLVTNALEENGFSFNVDKATRLLSKVKDELAVLDEQIREAFPPRTKLIREIIPRATKYGTISLSSIPKHLRDATDTMGIGHSFSIFSWEEFNPSSHKQIIQVLNEAGWKPEEKTQSHIDTERELNKLRYTRQRSNELDLARKTCEAKLAQLKKVGWKVNEANLATLPDKAPKPARTLAKRILLESRRRTLTEWIELVCFEIRIEKGNAGETGTLENFLTQSGLKEKESSVKPTEIPTSIRLEKITKETTSNILTDYQSKTLISWLKSKRINVEFVKENENCLWITVTGQAQFADFSALIATAISAGTKRVPLRYEVTSERIKGNFYGIGAWTQRMSHQKPNTANIPNEFDTNNKKKLYGKELRSFWQAPKNRLLVGVDAEGIQLRIFAHYVNSPELTDALVNGKKEDKTDPHSFNQRVLGDVCKSRAAAKRFIYALFLGAGLDKLAAILGCSREQVEEALDRLLKQYPGFEELKTSIIPSDAKRGWFLGLDGRTVGIPGDTVGTRKHLAMSGYLQNGEAIVVKLTTIRTLERMKREGYEGLLVNIVHDEVVIEVPNDVRRAEYVSKIFCEEITKVGEDLGLKCPLAGDGHVGLNWYEIH